MKQKFIPKRQGQCELGGHGIMKVILHTQAKFSGQILRDFISDIRRPKFRGPEIQNF